MEECNKGILKIGEMNCIITFKIHIQIFLKRFYIKRVVIPVVKQVVKPVQSQQ